MYQKKKQNKRGSTTYGSGSRKKNRGSGNTGGVGKGGIWDHKKGSAKFYKKIEKINRVKIRKKNKRKTEILTKYLSSIKYIRKLEKKNCLVDSSTKEITILKNCKLKYNLNFFQKIGYKIKKDTN